ncbi:MAG TPA: hypothetical protein VMA32_02410 [Streptosporangiaceae bacterium]|nr:hypothetical protein [Streptosporangiaceae bacterium]
MPDSETFDAFYARTVWSVTSQMHELAGDDGLADHAIREAYARAYQQWYQVSGYGDTEEWVLSTAREAYERRRAEAGLDRHAPAAEAADSGTWPGIYRPRPDPARAAAADADQRALDPDATVARPRRHARIAPDVSASAPAGADYPATGAVAGSPAPTAPTRRSQRPGGDRLGQPGSRRTLLIAGCVVAVLLVATVAYLVSGGHKKTPSATGGSSPSVGTTPKPQMLPAGKTGQRPAVPWVLVSSGWALAELSTAAPDSAGSAAGAGTYTTYLVDPEGGRYVIATSSGGTEPHLLAWSGNNKMALFDTGAAASPGSYQLLDVHSGRLTSLPLPAGVVALGFTRPDGKAILAVQAQPHKFRLQRYTLTGQLQASLASLPRKLGAGWLSDDCSYSCALSSPDGLTDVWGITGDEMQVLSNAGGKAHKLHVEGSGHPPSCVPLTWWSDTTILADCALSDLPDDAARLWLVPDDGSAPTALTAATPAGNGRIYGAWLAGQTTYVTSATSEQCSSAPSGPGGMDILPLGQGASAAVTIPGSTRNFSTIVATAGKRLLVLTQTQCPGTSSLVWFDPSTGDSQTVITAPASQVGVIAAVPYGNGPTAVTNGDSSSG